MPTPQYWIIYFLEFAYRWSRDAIMQSSAMAYTIAMENLAER
ncbi:MULTISPECIES: hypothetical protein [unclassified Nostoc]|nr:MULTISPECIES: hypothetical protein [unclassified Nostoc]MDM9583444.1 hypothetical protein [Nostoc sp. GT001]MDZ7947641.1 hypothetical protein [Nostoc sp. EfeVER01]MDZ7994854.1 hypothetical protein [Nostoc sp. EspVER01]